MKRLCFAYIFLLSLLEFSYCQTPHTKPVSDNNPYEYRIPGAEGTGKFYLGREIAPVMGPGGIAWLDRPERQSEENTDLAIAKMPISATSVVADIGAGTGYYSFKIAKLVPNGKVYAVEIQDEMINELQSTKAATQTSNVEIIKGDTMQVNLPPGSVDLALMVDVYHELSWPREMLASIHQALKPGGLLLLIEYRGEDASVPIKKLHKTTVSQLTKELKANGFSLHRKSDFLPLQHFLLFKKVAIM